MLRGCAPLRLGRRDGSGRLGEVPCDPPRCASAEGYGGGKPQGVKQFHSMGFPVLDELKRLVPQGRLAPERRRKKSVSSLIRRRRRAFCTQASRGFLDRSNRRDRSLSLRKEAVRERAACSVTRVASSRDQAAAACALVDWGELVGAESAATTTTLAGLSYSVGRSPELPPGTSVRVAQPGTVPEILGRRHVRSRNSSRSEGPSLGQRTDPRSSQFESSCRCSPKRALERPQR